MSIKIDPHAHRHGKELRQAVKQLREGGIVIYPTETAYALGADATNAHAVRRIFEIKNRDWQKSLPLIVGSLTDAERVAHFSRHATELAKRHWPGPLTLVLPVRASSGLAPGIVSDGMVALRVSSHPIARALARGLGKPITSTSANVSGEGQCHSVRTIHKQFKHFPPHLLIIDAGSLPRRKVSTIVRLRDGNLEIIRKGSARV